jgi:hypothetical protein
LAADRAFLLASERYFVDSNTLCHALAFAAVHFGLPRTVLAEIYLQYCAEVEASESKPRLDS